MRDPETVAFEVTERYQAFKDAAAIIRADRQEVVEQCCRIVKSWGDQCAGGSGEEIIPSGPSKGQRYGEAYYNLEKAIRSALAPKQ